MKKYLIIAFLVIVAVAFSFVLIPGDKELALMQFRDKEFEKARTAYEKRFEEGNLTVDVVSALTNLYLQSGDVDKAIELMERFVETAPNDLRARQELGKLYQFAQRPDDYLANLEEINRIQSNPDSLRTMNEMYAASQQYGKQEPALEALVGTKDSRQPNHYRNLVQLKSSQKKLGEAIAVYKEFREVYPDEFKFEDTELLMTFQLELDDLDGAYETALMHAQKNPPIREIAGMVNTLHYRGDAPTALRLLEPYESQLPQYPLLGVEKAYILLAQRKTKEAYEVLSWLDGQSALPANLQREFISMLVRDGKYEPARDRLKGLEIAGLQEIDLIGLIELGLFYPKAELMPIIDEKIPAELYDRYVVLGAAHAVAKSKEDASERLALIDKRQMLDAQKLQMANICLRRKRNSCVKGFLESLNESALTRSELLAMASIYMDIGQYDRAALVVDPLYRQAPEDSAVSAMYIQLAAADGRAQEVDRWLAANPNASEEALRNIYFTAQRYRHSDIALDVVDRLAKNYQNDENFGFLISAYMANGRYEAVLPYFRDKASLTASDREDYLFVLTKLARKNGRYSQELIEFASKEIRRSDVSAKQKQALVYSLIDAGRPDVVLPFIEELARNQGGQWIQIYADNLDKIGRHAEARDFRMRIATNPSTSASARRVIAYQLLERGFVEDSQTLFAMLADGASPESSDVQQLLYLWGVRPSLDKVEWLGMRYANEQDPEAKAKWANYITNYTSRDDLLDAVTRFPALVNEKQVQDRYFEALYKLGQLEAYGDDLLTREDISPSALRIFARVARGYNLFDHTVAAYYRLNEVMEGDPEAMRVLGIMAFGRADYSEVYDYLVPYAEYREDNPGYHEEDYVAYHYLAETLKRDRDHEGAHAYFAKALEAVTIVPEANIDTVSKTAQSLIGYGEEQQGRDFFASGSMDFPTERLLAADRISSMIELKDYDLARELLEVAPPANMNYGVVGDYMPLPPTNITPYQVVVDGNEALLRFNGSVPKGFPLSGISKAQYPWVSYSAQSYNEILIVADSDITLEIQPLSQDYALAAIKTPNPAEAKFAKELEVRMQMLEARIGLETGDHYEVTDELVELSEQYPDNATLLGYTANALNFTGRWKYAQRLLEQAHAIMPTNEDILSLQRDINIRRDAESHVKLDYEWVSIGDSSENIWTLSGLVYVDDEFEVGAKLQTVDVDAVNVRRIDGRVGNFDEDAQRGEIYVAYEDEGGQRIQGSLYGNNDTIGLGLSYRWLNDFGMSRVYAEYQRPNWDFVEGILDDATRDRIGFEHSYVHNTLWSFNGGLAFNRYNLRGADDVAQSVSGLFSATRKLQDAGPYLALNYTLDAEYRTSEKSFVDNTGVSYFPLLDSREVHTLSVIAAEEFGEQTDGLVQAGYSFDRLGGNGPLVAGQLTHQMFEEQLEAQVRGSYGARTSDNEGDTARVGGHLKWRF